MNAGETGASLLVLGSGTSVGVPMIGCACKVCQSADPRDKRLRPSVLFRIGPRRILVDTSPDFREQALRYRIDRIDAILYTHSHADHILGLDDIRPFNFLQRDFIPVYGSLDTLAMIARTFAYVFNGEPSASSRPRISRHCFEAAPFTVHDLQFEPILAYHGQSPVHGFRFENCAYLTDHSEIPPESIERLRGLDVLFLDALRHNPHPTHSTVEQSLRTVEQLQPRRAFFTHISHDLRHADVEAQLPPHVRLAYDGLEVPLR